MPGLLLSTDDRTASTPRSPASMPSTGSHAGPPATTTSNPQSSANGLTATAVPVALNDNTDAIALRSAISILELQRRQAEADIQTLSDLKTKATASPKSFGKALRAGRIKSGGGSGEVLGAVLGDVRPAKRFKPTPEQDNEDGEEETESEEEGKDDSDSVRAEEDFEDDEDPARTSFPPIPLPQNIVRCPPVNWAKYHVIGESLDKLHAEQQNRPSQGSLENNNTLRQQERPPVAVIAAPMSITEMNVGIGKAKAKKGDNEATATRSKGGK